MADPVGDEVELTKEQEAEFKKAFTLYDKDKDNKLSSAEIGPALRSCALTPTEAELNAIISNIDSQGGFADFPEFLSYAARLLPEKDPEELLREAFTRWDTNNCGFLNATALREAMVTMGEPLTEEEADEMIKEALPSGDGQINYEDLLVKLIKEYR
ncbi:neo-calmodulin-like isoform X2 [Lineus longissimus]|uniref:neo-calmodulin-like isoform X2 n=1 Tax=Lineus longissimus TaxID=88925 RepID=UPI002B4D5A14